MTSKEAIKELEWIDQYEVSDELKEIIIEAIKKQILKKPTNIYKRCGYVVEGCCQCCGKSVLPEQKFCSNCGQAINWSEEERSCSNCKWNGTKCYDAPEGLRCNDCTQWRAIDEEDIPIEYLKNSGI